MELREITEPEYGLPQQLEFTRAITNDDVEHIRGGETVSKKVDRLLSVINYKVEDCSFTAALDKTNQRHVSNFIRKKGGKLL